MAYIDLELRIHCPDQPFKPHQQAEWVKMKVFDLLHQYFNVDGAPFDVDVYFSSDVKECDQACRPIHPTACEQCGVVARTRYNPRCRGCGAARP